jgi:hypothetical protein
MTNYQELLEQLSIPQPPYRMPRPTAVLTAEPIVPPKNFSISEAIEEQEQTKEVNKETEIKRIANEIRQEIQSAPPLEGATAEEIAEDLQNRQAADTQIAEVMEAIPAIQQQQEPESTEEPVRPAPEIERVRERAEAEGMGTAREETPEPTETERLREENRRLQAQLEDLMRQRESYQSGGSSEQSKAKSTVEQAASRAWEIGKEQGLAFWKEWSGEQSATKEDWKAAIAAILAKKWQGRFERRNEKIKKLEERGKEVSKQGAFGMTRSYVWHEAWINYHKWRGRKEFNKFEAWNDERVRRENTRDEILNQAAARVDRILDSVLEQIDQLALARDEQDALLEEQHTEHRTLTGMLAKAETDAEHAGLRALLDALEKRMKDAAEEKKQIERRWQIERKRAAKQQAEKERLLGYAVRPTRVDTTPPAYDWLLQRKTRPGGSPKARVHAQRRAEIAA